jgi:histidine triad (HIT) family protein
MTKRCVFCEILEGKIFAYKVYEDDWVLAFLDIHPSAPGHTLIIPKVHFSRLEHLPVEDAKYLFRALHSLVGRIQEAMEAPSSTIGINNGRESGQEVPHIHIHVIPRHEGDRGGIIQGVAGGITKLKSEDFATVAEKIRLRVC